MSYFNTYSPLKEEKLQTKDRNELPDEAFGIPSLRKYPLHDKAHTLQAIKMFNHVPKEHEEELARNIIKKMEEYNIPKESVGPNNRLRNYL